MKKINFDVLSPKTRSFIKYIEGLAKRKRIKLNYYILPASHKGGWGYQQLNGDNAIDVCVADINDLSVFEVNLVHELIHTRHTLLEFPLICVNRNVPNDHLERISNFSSLAEHLELYPYLSVLGFSNDYFFDHNYKRLLDGKEALINVFNNLDKCKNDPTIEAANTISLLEIYLFADDEKKQVINSFFSKIKEKCEMWTHKLEIGCIRDTYLCEKNFSGHEISVESYLKNIKRLRNILSLNDYIGVKFNNTWI